MAGWPMHQAVFVQGEEKLHLLAGRNSFRSSARCASDSCGMRVVSASAISSAPSPVKSAAAAFRLLGNSHPSRGWQPESI